MLETVEQQTRPKPAWSVLWLHGLGADGHDFAPIVPELVRPDWPGIRFVFPHAPVRPVTINNGVPMRAWYDIRNLSIDQRADEEGLRASMAEVDALIARERDRGVPASPACRVTCPWPIAPPPSSPRPGAPRRCSSAMVGRTRWWRWAWARAPAPRWRAGRCR